MPAALRFSQDGNHFETELCGNDWSRDGALVRALAFHHCVPGSISSGTRGVICGLSLLLILYSAPRGFSPGAPVFPSTQKTNI